MSTAAMFLCILIGMMLGAEALTLRELEQKINNLDKLEQSVKWLVKEVNNLKVKKNNFSGEIEQKLDTVENLDKGVDNLTNLVSHLNQQVANLEIEITGIQNQLEYGGAYPYNSKYVQS